jgi:hypothetical protein
MERRIKARQIRIGPSPEMAMSASRSICAAIELFLGEGLLVEVLEAEVVMGCSSSRGSDVASGVNSMSSVMAGWLMLHTTHTLCLCSVLFCFLVPAL